jgi:hypothetical protein
MAFTLTDAASASASATVLKPSLVLEIDGYDYYFGVSNVKEYIKVGDVGLLVDGSWVIGGKRNIENVYPYITMDGTSSSISQQLNIDKGGATSVTSMQISLVDVNELITRLITPNLILPDLLGREAVVYLGFQDNVFPDDYITIFNGMIDEISGSGVITLNIANAEQMKRQDLFTAVQVELDGAITNSQTTITVSDTLNLLLPVTGKLSTYIKINDEIIQYTGISGNDLTGCVRAQFDTIAASAADGDSVSTFYRLQGTAIELALWMMLSGPNEYYKTGVGVDSFTVDINSDSLTSNSLYFNGIDMMTRYGLTVGSYITVAGSASNDFTLRTITSITVTGNGTEVVVSGAALTLEEGSAGTCSFKSQYNILTDGCGMGPHQVDVAEYERVQTLLSSSIPTYDFYITETIKAKEFIDQEILYPANLFTLPKKGRTSLGFVAPPLAVSSLAVLDANALTEPSKIKSKRSINRYFYNSAIYKYNYDAIETDRPLTGYILTDTDSRAQIPVGTKAITISSKGMRNNEATSLILSINARRLLAKYKYAAEMFTVSATYGKLFNVDVGDVVLFGDESMPLVDTKTGVRGLTPRLCEVVDKKMDIKTGKCDIVIVDTNYLVDGRYGIFSPSSIIAAGSTTTQLVITDSFGTAFPKIEKSKWVSYVGMNLTVHSPDWSTSYDTRLASFDPVNPYLMNIDTIAGVPLDGWIVDIQNYPSGIDDNINRVYKNVFCFADPKVDVVSGVSPTEFVVGGGDVSKFRVGAQIMLHNADWSSVSPDVRVLEINTNNIVVDKALGFTPSSSYDVELIGFADSGSAYRYL